MGSFHASKVVSSNIVISKLRPRPEIAKLGSNTVTTVTSYLLMIVLSQLTAQMTSK